MPLTYNTLDARIQLKMDTQANWDTKNQVALAGEIIIYAPDTPTGTHSYARLKVGDGTTLIKNLPFIDAGTINGKLLEEVIRKYDTYSDFPKRGDESNHGGQQSLYVDKASGKIFYWDGQQYVQIGGVTYNPTTINVKTVTAWDAGSASTVSINNHTLIIMNGTVPSLTTGQYSVVTSLSPQ